MKLRARTKETTKTLNVCKKNFKKRNGLKLTEQKYKPGANKYSKFLLTALDQHQRSVFNECFAYTKVDLKERGGYHYKNEQSFFSSARSRAINIYDRLNK